MCCEFPSQSHTCTQHLIGGTLSHDTTNLLHVGYFSADENYSMAGRKLSPLIRKRFRRTNTSASAAHPPSFLSTMKKKIISLTNERQWGTFLDAYYKVLFLRKMGRVRDWLLTKTGFRRRVRRRYRSDDKSLLVSFPQKIESIIVLMETVRRKWWYIMRIVSRMSTVKILADR